MTQLDEALKLVESLKAEKAAVKEAVRELHEVLRDVRVERKALEQRLAQLPAKAEAAVDEHIAKKIEATLNDIVVKSHQMYDSIMRNFDELAQPVYEALGLAGQYVELRKAREEADGEDQVPA